MRISPVLRFDDITDCASAYSLSTRLSPRRRPSFQSFLNALSVLTTMSWNAKWFVTERLAFRRRAFCHDGNPCCPEGHIDMEDSIDLMRVSSSPSFVLRHLLTARYFFNFPGYEGRHWVTIMPHVRGLLSDADSPLA
jgi:hypothetical protein